MNARDYQTPAVILHSSGAVSSTGAAVDDWVDFGRVWCRIEGTIDPTGERVADRGVKASRTYRVVCRWWETWREQLTQAARLRIGQELHQVRSVSERWRGRERQLVIEAEAVL